MEVARQIAQSADWPDMLSKLASMWLGEMKITSIKHCPIPCQQSHCLLADGVQKVMLAKWPT